MLKIHLPKNVELFIWAVMPACVTLFLFLFCTIPKHLWGINSAMPVLPLISIFYWGRVKTPEIPLWFAFLVGLLTDIIGGTPLGLSALLYLLFLLTLHERSKHLQNEGFMFIWWYFVMLLMGFCLLQFVIMSGFGNQFSALTPAFLQLFLTAGLYPLFHKLFDLLAEKCQHRRWLITHI
jgi:rod shape-determining protein MreD